MYVIGEPPANVPVLVLTVLIVEALFLGFALATSGLTNSPDHAQVTTLPIFLIAAGAAMWVALTGTEDLALVKRLVPGGTATELAISAWNGIDMSEVIPLALPTLAWILVAFVVASQFFRWEPRK